MHRPKSIFALALAGAALSAHEPGTLSGHVKDAGGRAVPGASVSVAGDRLDLKLATGPAGVFLFTGLKPGGYAVLIQRAGFQGVRRFVDLREEHGAELELTLQPYVASTTVDVVDRAGVIHLSDLDAPVNHLLGIADSASQGVVTPEKLSERAYLRTGEILETVPGLLISQHSGEGKANQYYLRGFDLDHGTDISATVAGLPVNMPTHAHGQGYSDLNFLIPELVRDIQYEKGTYFAQEGDFSAAGAVHIDYVHALDRPLAQVELGADGYRRFLAAGSVKVGQGDLLAAMEVFHNDGPWVNPDNYQKFNGVLRYSWVGASDSFEVTAMSYSGRWNSSDQVAQRAIDQSLISRFGEIDPTDGGASHRNSLTAAWQHAEQGAQTRVEAYVSSYALNLISNFTYFLNDPVNGDQFEQVDHRIVSGLRASQRWSSELFGHRMDNELGLQVRNDTILGLDLYHTKARQVLSTGLEDRVTQTSEAFYWENKIQWAPTFRTVFGVREDLYQFNVRSNTPQNGGLSNADLASPKVSFVFGPWRDTEFYLSGGYGFHSNDARGTTITVDPKTGTPQDRVTPLVRAKGFEAGVRTSIIPAWQSTLSFWRLDIESELTFAGDDGTTSPSRPSRRQGIEWNNEIHLTDRLSFNADLAYSTAVYFAYDPVGDHIPQSIAGVGVAGVAWRPVEGLQLSVLDRYFGPRYLIEDGSIRSKSANQVQAQARWAVSRNLTLTFDVFNLFNTQATDIDYFYTSRLPGEPVSGVEDVHLHPVAPREWRAGALWRF